jgi:hypothetical protein
MQTAVETAPIHTKPDGSGLKIVFSNWFPGSAWKPISRGSASLLKEEAEPPDMGYQAGAW